MRVVILLFVLFIVAANSWLTKARTTDWDNTLWVGVYPINADNSPLTDAYIKQLSDKTFQPIELFMQAEARRHRVALRQPVTVKLAPTIMEMPPAPPRDGNRLKIVWWSLKMRYWSWQVKQNYDVLPDNIQMFVLYHDPRKQKTLDHSLGLQKGMVGVVHAFASSKMTQKNNIVIAHEMLHTVGATDKYDASNNMPLFPDGYAEPDQNPRYPQRMAEVMGGRVPLSETRARIPNGLKHTVIGRKTAQEINWVQ